VISLERGVVDADGVLVQDSNLESTGSTAGASAQHQADQRRRARETQLRARHKRLGGLILAVSEEPQSIRAWSQGAKGERRLGAGLDGLATRGVSVLHDRQRPGTRANIDHVAVAASGIWIIDSKNYKGRIERRDVGSWFSTDLRLFVDGRDRTKLLVGLGKQRAAIDDLLRATSAWPVPVHSVVCFVDGDFPLLAKPFALSGHLVTWPKALYRRITTSGTVGPQQQLELIATLERHLPPAV
jgi:hypothetical protein